ncbi:hypothetical protein Pyn_26409 [Prunus yedoensis var. nudiflora]|uniref:Uncharacterized protein n=1 Tax=Prunus yedoensis var. nudiflora TaxID=2094558 RepID=A0A314ZUI1_PRUYE|nr:hypothetical protein Pyn_26409 [Prunus yedoensis var. nudiflora]
MKTQEDLRCWIHDQKFAAQPTVRMDRLCHRRLALRSGVEGGVGLLEVQEKEGADEISTWSWWIVDWEQEMGASARVKFEFLETFR